jgi:hypothetical protein
MAEQLPIERGADEVEQEPERGRSAGALYGTILVLAIVVGLSEDPDAGAGFILGGVLITTLVFWAVHVYAETLAQHLAHPHWTLRADVAHAASREWPLVEAAAPPALPLFLGAVGVLSRTAAINLAIALGLLNLFGWGVAVGRAMGQPLSRAIVTGLVNVVLGGIMVVLKAFVHH